MITKGQGAPSATLTDMGEQTLRSDMKGKKHSQKAIAAQNFSKCRKVKEITVETETNPTTPPPPPHQMVFQHQ